MLGQLKSAGLLVRFSDRLKSDEVMPTEGDGDQVLKQIMFVVVLILEGRRVETDG